jgi:hypothetical protein
VGIFDDIKAKGAAYRLTEEALYAEALREIESGQRRDGIWAKAMAESDMDQGKAGAKYIKMRVQSLKDEVTVFIAAMKKAEGQKSLPMATQQEPEKPSGGIVRGFMDGMKEGASRDDGPDIKNWKDFFDFLKGLALVVIAGIVASGFLSMIGVIK